MAQVLLEDKNQVVDIPDGLTPQETETALRKFYTPEELYGATTFGEREAYRVSKGRANVDVGKSYYNAMMGTISDDVARQIEKESMANYTKENDEKYQAHNWGERMVGATTELAPYMLDSALNGYLYGETVGVGFGAITLASGLGAPAAIPAYVTGKAVGQAWGTWQNAAQVEGGFIYKSLLEDGLDGESARNWAIAGGYLNGAIELLQIGQVFNKFLPFGKATVTELIKKATKQGSQNLAKKFAKTSLRLGTQLAIHTVPEITEELAQETISLIAETGANIFDEATKEQGYSGPDKEEFKNRLMETLTESLIAFPLLGLPGSIHTTLQMSGRDKVATAIATQRGQEALNLELTDQIAEATKFDNLKDFSESLPVEIDNAYASKYGFDNRTLYAEAVWNASREVKGEDTVIEDIIKNEGKEEISEPVEVNPKLSPKEGGTPTAKGGEIESAKEKTKPSELISKEQAKGRVNKLIDDSNQILKQITSLERQKERLVKSGKSVVALDGELSKLAKQYDFMDSQIAEIMTTDGINLSEEKITLKARELEAIEKKIILSAKSEEKLNQKSLQKEKANKIKEIKQALVDYANEQLPKTERGAFLTATMNVKTKKQLDAQITRVNEYAEAANKRGLVRQIKRQVERIAKSKSISIDYVQQIQDFINNYELKGHNEDTIKGLKKTQAFIESERQAGRNVEMPSYVLDALEILARKPLSELSSADLQNISDKIKVMADLGKTKLRSRRAADKLLKARDLQAIKQDSKAINSKKIKEGNAISGKITSLESFLNGVKQAMNFAQLKDLVITPIDAVFDRLDGAKNYLGANYRIFKRRIDVAHSIYLQAKFDITQRVDAKANDLNLNQDNMERIGLYAAKVQEGGEEKLLSFFTQEQIDSVVLTDSEMEFYKFLRKELDNLRPQIEKVMREVYNKPLGAVENYFPFMTDFEAMSDKEIRDRFGDKVTTHYDSLKKNVEMGFTEKRVGGKNRIKLNAAEIFGAHIDNAEYLIHVGKETKYLGELAGTEEYGEAVGDVGQEIVREWVDLIARKGVTQDQRIRLLDIARNYTGLVALGFKLSSTLVQVTSLMDGAAMIGGHAFSGFGKVVTSSEWRAFCIDNMPELRSRIGDDPAFQDFKKDSFAKRLNDLAYLPLKTIDKFAACGVASGAYTKYCEDNGIAVDLNNPNPEGIAYAQKMMRRTQSSSQFKDLPLAVTKGKLSGNVSLDKIILQFQSFMLNRWSLIRHDFWRAGIMGKNKKEAVNIAMWLIAANFAEVGIRKWTKEMIAELTGDELPEDDEDKQIEKNVGQVLSNIPFMGSLYYAIKYRNLPVPSIDMARKILTKLGIAVSATSNEDMDEDEIMKKWLSFVATATPGGQQFEGFLKEEE